MTIILIIMLFGGTDGGRAISTELRFQNMAACERAAEKIMDVKTTWKPIAVCVEQR